MNNNVIQISLHMCSSHKADHLTNVMKRELEIGREEAVYFEMIVYLVTRTPGVCVCVWLCAIISCELRTFKF